MVNENIDEFSEITCESNSIDNEIFMLYKYNNIIKFIHCKNEYVSD